MLRDEMNTRNESQKRESEASVAIQTGRKMKLDLQRRLRQVSFKYSSDLII